MKSTTKSSYLFLLFFLYLSTSFAQQKVIDEDLRITKYKKEIIKSLSNQNPDIKISDSANADEFQIAIKKRLEIFSDSLNNDVLLVQFFILADHAYPRWGILTYDNYYFFSDTDDLGESDLQKFIKKYDHITVETIISYCNYFPPPEYGGGPLGINIYKTKMSLIKQYLDDKEETTINDVNSAVLFLTEVTGIRPQTKRNQSAQLILTKEDYTKWLNWLSQNDSRLYWDDKEKKVKVKE